MPKARSGVLYPEDDFLAALYQFPEFHSSEERIEFRLQQIRSEIPIMDLFRICQAPTEYSKFLQFFEPTEKMFEACVISGHLKMVKWYLEQGYNPNMALSLAIINNRLPIVQEVVERGIHRHNEYLVTMAASRGFIDIVKYLGDNKFPVHFSALKYSARYGHLEQLKYLLQFYAISDHDDKLFRTAAEYNQIDIVKYLISQGAQIHARADEPLKWAVENRNRDLVEFLIQHGANPRARHNAFFEKYRLITNQE